jgi:outer membrane protein insertion porin family
MLFNFKGNLGFYEWLKNLFFFSLILSSCTIVKNYQKQKPILISNNVITKGGNFSNDDRIAIKQRMLGQLDDSSIVIVKDAFFAIHVINHPPAYDSGYSVISARNMRASMLHLGYYNAKVTFKADTIRLGKQERVHVNYTVEAGAPTLIDTVAYNLYKPELQQLALQTKNQSFLVVGKPISKAAVSNEIGRLVDLYRSNGYYKFTAEDIKMIGDTTIALLTTTSDDPLENLKLLAEADQKKNKPTIKLEIILNPSADINQLKKFYINNVFIYPDLHSNDIITDTVFAEKDTTHGYIICYHNKLFRNSFLRRNIFLKKGDIYNISNYTKTLNNLSKIGVWQSVNIDVEEPKDSIGKVDMSIQLLPAKRNVFETSIETSYSTNSSSNVTGIATAGNLLGVDGDISLEKRNLGKEGIKMTNTIHAGVELNLTQISPSNDIVNSNELGFTNTITVPRMLAFPKIKPLHRLDSLIKVSGLDLAQSFMNTSISYVDRINLFDQQTLSFALGWQWSINTTNRSRSFILKPLNVEFSYLYNQSAAFIDTLNANPYLKYSFNTALVLGTSFGYSSALTIANKQLNFKLNAEESGYPFFIIPLGPLNVFKNYIRQYLKTDVEFTYTVNAPKSAKVSHLFIGVGAPLSKNDIALPFFKQYYSGGANSMRGWPIRGIGVGGQALPPYNSTVFNDQTGDIKLEGNFEYRYNILQIIPNSLVLKGALFIDAGNIWDFKTPDPANPADSANLGHFNITNVYKQLGVDIGTGFRFDFNYFLLRFDMGFRVKRPDILDNAGWQLPDITLANLFKRGVNDENRIWRYNNFNFTIGIGYPF